MRGFIPRLSMSLILKWLISLIAPLCSCQQKQGECVGNKQWKSQRHQHLSSYMHYISSPSKAWQRIRSGCLVSVKAFSSFSFSNFFLCTLFQFYWWTLAQVNKGSLAPKHSSMCWIIDLVFQRGNAELCFSRQGEKQRTGVSRFFMWKPMEPISVLSLSFCSEQRITALSNYWMAACIFGQI